MNRTRLCLSNPLDQPERLKCKCGCDHFKIYLEGRYEGLEELESINSVECEGCHEIYTLRVEDWQ